MRRRALPMGMLNGVGRVVAWRCLKRCGLRPGDGPDMIGPVKLDLDLLFILRLLLVDDRRVKATRDYLDSSDG
jgi:hypothetical protein